MFTPGSKYFLGLTGLSVVSAILYMFFVNPNDLGVVALFGVAVAGATIAGFTLLTRDGDSDTANEAVEAAAQPITPSMWPLAFALSLAVVLVGMATRPMVFVVGVGLFFGSGIEWTVQNWANRASADAEFNGFVRARAISALEYPGLAAVAGAIIAFFFSRVMLGVSKEGAPIIFMIAAAFILVVGIAVAFKPSFRGKPVVATIVASVLVLAAAGVAFTVKGERSELAVASKEDHYNIANRECGEESGHFDHLPNNRVSMRSSVAATITVEDGKAYAQLVGLPTKVDTVTIPRSNATTILFRNKDEEVRRLVVNLGTKTVAETGVVEKVGVCTQLVEKGKENALTITVPKPSSAEQQYSFTVPGVTGEIKLVVP
jgi:hypothetical protein